MFYKRKRIAICFISILILILSTLFTGCLRQDLPPIKQGNIYKDFSVNFLDVGQGDCIFIRLPDEKNLLIDCALNDASGQNSKLIVKTLEDYSVEKIDYFILTHPDLDHIGNAKDILNNFAVENLYVPYISPVMIDAFAYYKEVVELAEAKGSKLIVSDYTIAMKERDYTLAFLSPLPKGFDESSYDELSSVEYPTDSQINNLSPIIYFECCGKRFVFTGDAGKKQEEIVIEEYELGIYDLLFKSKDIKVNLENIDYLKVSHHGSDGATKEEFLSLLRPKNFIISVGQDNFYGHPKSEVLELIALICPESKIYRTDQNGTITIHKDNENKVVISTAK